MQISGSYPQKKESPEESFILSPGPLREACLKDELVPAGQDVERGLRGPRNLTVTTWQLPQAS
jgi:hypothetical protein